MPKMIATIPNDCYDQYLKCIINVMKMKSWMIVPIVVVLLPFVVVYTWVRHPRECFTHLVKQFRPRG